MADCTSCAIAEKVSRLEEQLDEYQAQNGDSHREIFGRLNVLEKSEAVQEVHYTAIMAKLDNLTQKVELLEQKPARRWEGLAEKALWAVAAAVIAFLLGRLGLG